MTDYTPQLYEALDRLTELIGLLRPLVTPSAHTGTPPAHRLFAYYPPVLEQHRSDAWVSDETLGLRKYVESLEQHLVLLTTMSKSGVSPSEDPLPNVIGSVTFAKQLLTATPPVVGIKLMLSTRTKAAQDFANGAAMGRGKGKRLSKKRQKGDKDEGFVDIVAQGGKEWIRIYSKKVSHLLSEFREQDSYINSDYDSDSSFDDRHSSDGNGNDNSRASSSSSTSNQRPALTNTLLDLAGGLQSLSRSCARPPGASPPRLTIRITRIEEFPEGGHDDNRIPATFQAIRNRGINLVFGDLEDQPLELPKTMWPDLPLKPARRINLDPTALLGICSDLLHHPLPADESEAKRRFFRPRECLLEGREGRHGNDGVGDWKGQSQNSRELVKGVLDECANPLIEEIRDTLADMGGEIEFWATEEAVQHVKEALGSDEMVGDGMEQMRMRRLVGMEEGDFFEGGRYEGKEGCLKGLRIHVFAPEPDVNGARDEAPNGRAHANRSSDGMTSFHTSLANICRQFVSEYYKTVDDPQSPESRILPSYLHPRRLPRPKVVQLSRPFQIVSLQSFGRGASEGMTTLCMGSVVFRELWTQPRWKPKGWHQGDYGLETGRNREGERRGDAAVWMLPYRCMGEGKRVKFEKGDYSYPT